VEIMYLCKRLGVPIFEVAVTWSEVPGSKLRHHQCTPYAAGASVHPDRLRARHMDDQEDVQSIVKNFINGCCL